MRFSRRDLLGQLLGTGGLGALASLPAVARSATLPRRELGRTGLRVSAVGFGGAGIGGTAFGAVSENEALDALSVAEELGCNFIDTARIYGASEAVLGKHLRGRRDRWVVATKYSGQKAGLKATLEEQLQRLNVDAVDVYQVHWVPREKDEALYEELAAVRREGKAKFIGVSGTTSADVDEVLRRGELDTLQLPFSLLQSEPMIAALPRLRAAGVGVIARSALREGFLTGKFSMETRFDPKTDVRGGYSSEEIARRVQQVRSLDFLRAHADSMTEAAIRYVLSFDGVATAIIGTKSAAQARENFALANARPLPARVLRRVARTQKDFAGS